MKPLSQIARRTPWTVVIAAAALLSGGCANWRPLGTASWFGGDEAEGAGASLAGADHSAAHDQAEPGSRSSTSETPRTGARSLREQETPRTETTPQESGADASTGALSEEDAARIQQSIEDGDLPEPIRQQLADWSRFFQTHDEPPTSDPADSPPRGTDVEPSPAVPVETTSRLASLHPSMSPPLRSLPASDRQGAQRLGESSPPEEPSAVERRSEKPTTAATSDDSEGTGLRTPPLGEDLITSPALRTQTASVKEASTSQRAGRPSGAKPSSALDSQEVAPEEGNSLSPRSDGASTPDGKTVEPMPFTPGQWRRAIAEAIVDLKQEIGQLDAEDGSRRGLEANLRLLQLVAGELDEALTPIECLEEGEQAYWTNQLHGLHVMLDDKGTPVASRRAALALRHLRESIGRLASSSTLDLHNLAFCSRVDSYGCWTEFPSNQFRPNQEVLLYVEVDNFGVEELPDAFETELQGSYQILDSSGRRLSDLELPLDKQECRDRRRDYFIAYRIYMPKDLAPGSYRLELTIRDVKSDKYGQTSVDFEIRR